jgi:hyperosmotically inducible periplasmic protein
MTRKTPLALAMAFALLGSAGAAMAQDKPKDKPDDTTIVIKDDTTPKVKKGAQATTDASITTAVKTRLMKDKVARGTSIDVDTKDGVVTIAGDVPTAADKTRIGQLVRNTTGVKKVDNNLKVAGAGVGTTGAKKDNDTKIVIKDDTTPALKKGVNAVQDGSITTAVKTRLMSDEVARGTHIDVDTNDGVVTIGGTVPTAADKTRIGQLVEHTTGVKRVVNKLKVGS